MAEELNACRNCGGKCDPAGWMRGDGLQGPECEGCGITTPDVESWNRLMGGHDTSQGGEAVAWQVTTVGALPAVYVEYPAWAVGDPTLMVKPLYTHPADQVAEGVVVSRELLATALAKTKVPYMGHGSFNSERVTCGECGNYEDGDGWGSVVEHREDCRFAAKKRAEEELRALLAKP